MNLDVRDRLRFLMRFRAKRATPQKELAKGVLTTSPDRSIPPLLREHIQHLASMLGNGWIRATDRVKVSNDLG